MNKLRFHPSMLLAPIAGASFLAFCLFNNAGPGAFALALVVSSILLFGQPLIQIAIYRSGIFGQRVFPAWGLSVVAAILPVVFAAALGWFSFW